LYELSVKYAYAVTDKHTVLLFHGFRGRISQIMATVVANGKWQISTTQRIANP